MKVTTSNLIRFSGLALVPAGIVFAGIQPIHPPDVVESVTTSAWAIITSLKIAMCVLFLVGITGLYARQAEKAGVFGLAGVRRAGNFVDAADGVCLRRSLHPAAAGGHGAGVCGCRCSGSPMGTPAT